MTLGYASPLVNKPALVHEPRGSFFYTAEIEHCARDGPAIPRGYFFARTAVMQGKPCGYKLSNWIPGLGPE